MDCNFSVGHYGQILAIALESGYRFIGFDDVIDARERVCILRHDVDYVPEWTVRIGELEQQLGIRSTFFFQVGARTYNLREAANYRAVRRLRELGHTIGLHFDPAWAPDTTWEQMPRLCHADKALFAAITGIEPCDIISFHNPHRFAPRILNQRIPGMRHTYEPQLFSAIKYLSDSQGWYEGCMCGVFAEQRYPAIQLLTHADYWPDETTNDFISDIAQLIKWRADELTDYVVDGHPVCRNNEARLRSELSASFQAVKIHE